ncbi:adenosylmethionine decarboxylase [Marinagarivorans algicola]|uniref:adenosylmethionine decarboxylase n=1 Tax=Marinagarivorans algicola TaxID=1513270 RepID=UPI003735230A
MNGLHAIIEAHGPIAHLSATELVTLMCKAAQAAGATVLQHYIHEFGPSFGHTGVVLLAESHISVHTWPETDYAAFDIFMCGQVSLDHAMNTLRAACPNSLLQTQILLRGHIPTRLPQQAPVVLARILLRNRMLRQVWLAHTSIQEYELEPAVTELVRFLVRCSQAKKTLEPPPRVKALWREFVLCTQIYESFCSQYLSHFVHYSNTPLTTLISHS